MEVLWKGGVEGFELGEVRRNAGVDGMLEGIVWERVEGGKFSADVVYVVVVMFGAGLHIVDGFGCISGVYLWYIESLEMNTGDGYAFCNERPKDKARLSHTSW